MDQISPLRLRDHLLLAADVWAARTGRSTGALSSVVANNGRALERLRDPATSVTDATIERFAAWLAEPDNWPDGDVATEALELAHRVGISTREAQDRAA